MTDKEILQKAIQKAIDSGWIINDIRWNDEMSVESVDFWFENDHGDLAVNNLIWRHDFAKKLWGEEEYFDPHIPEIMGLAMWQYHLQEMVIAEDPIQYLAENI